MKIHYSSQTNEWSTPQCVFDALHAEFGFTLDVAATPENAKCDRFFTIDDDGLLQDWSNDVCWMNPPYGREIGKWVAKAFLEAKKGAVVVGLIPARTETSYWHEFILPSAEIRFVRGRLKFGTAKHNAPFPNAVVIWR